MIKALKVILLIIAISIGIGVLGALFFVYKEVKSSDLNSYVAKTTKDY